MRKVKSVQTEAAFCWTSIWVWQHFNLKNKLKKTLYAVSEQTGLTNAIWFLLLNGFLVFLCFSTGCLVLRD